MRQYADVSKAVSRAMFSLDLGVRGELVERIDGLYKAVSTHYGVLYDFPESPEIGALTVLCTEIEGKLVEFERWVEAQKKP